VKKRGNARGAKGRYDGRSFRRKERSGLSKTLEPTPRPQKSDREKLRDLQRKLYIKAKQEEDFRFYSLYDKLTVPYVLWEAYRQSRANGGAPGVDGKTYGMIEKEGVEGFLQGIEKELKAGTYRPGMVKRVYIPKANGKMRPLGIPTIKDRVVQTACKLVIEPIFEADFQEESYGYRPQRGAQDAIGKIREHLEAGRTEVYDADLSAYFDTIPHQELMKLLGRRISDGKILHLIKMWLKAPIWEGGKTKGGKGNKMGTPQGGVISPLLANIYLNLLDKAVKRRGGVFERAGVRLVRYADDFLLMAKRLNQEVLEYLSGMLGRMKVKLNVEKSRLVYSTAEPIHFLGFTIRHDRDRWGRNKKYINIFPGERALRGIKRKVDKILKTFGHWPPETVAGELNAIIRGWIGYFSIPQVSYPQQAKRKLRYYLYERISRYYRRKSQRKSKLYNQGAYNVLVKRYGLIEPTNCFFRPAPVNA
jgi:RNA-directed DNA polymerase